MNLKSENTIQINTDNKSTKKIINIIRNVNLINLNHTNETSIMYLFIKKIGITNLINLLLVETNSELKIR